MNNLNGKSVLLFCPRFFSYEKEIQKAIEGLGATVVWFDDRPGNDFLSKALIRINKNFLKKKIKNYYKKILKQLKDKSINFDYLFFVNPEAVSTSILEEFRLTYPTAKCLLYMWDSFKNRKRNIELLRLFDDIFTFDSEDAIMYGIKLRALFYSKIYENLPLVTLYKYDILFIGTAHTDRYNFVKKATKAFGDRNVKFYFYLSSKVLFYINKLTSKDFRNVKYGDVSFDPLTHTDIVQLVSESKAILDINHPNQIGLTMRTLETLGAQRKLVTTNNEIINYDFYDPANILVIDRNEPVINMAFIDADMRKIDEKTLYKYSIEGWTKEIFGLI